MKNNKLIYLVICLIALGVIIWFFMKGQLGQGLIYLLLLICPLIHLLMMKGMHSMPASKENHPAKQLKDSETEKHSCH